MKNSYGLDPQKLDILAQSNRQCVYCRKVMDFSHATKAQRDWSTIEHLNTLPPWDDIETVVFCCGSCNASRSDSQLIDWLNSRYCTERGITFDTVALAVQAYIKKYGKSIT